jgi:hypothetical protein
MHQDQWVAHHVSDRLLLLPALMIAWLARAVVPAGCVFINGEEYCHELNQFLAKPVGCVFCLLYVLATALKLQPSARSATAAVELHDLQLGRGLQVPVLPAVVHRAVLQC